MIYEHRFTVAAPLDVVRGFHRRSANLRELTPPPVVVRVVRAPEILQDGDEMAFTLWLGPLPIHWVARIEQTTPTGFVDRQLAGPFALWIHRHTFRAVTITSTEVTDQIEVKLSRQLHWQALGMIIWLNLPLLFVYRQWQTKRLFERNKT